MIASKEQQAEAAHPEKQKQMSISIKEQAARLRAGGQSIEATADRLQVTPSYIKQLEGDQIFQRLYSELTAGNRISKHRTYQHIDDNWDKLETIFTDALVENANEVVAMMASKPKTLIDFGRMLNGAKRRASGETAPSLPGDGDTVILELPNFITDASRTTTQVQHNSQQEIIEVDGRTLVAMGSDQLDHMLDASHSEAAEALPAPTTSTSAAALLLNQLNLSKPLDPTTIDLSSI